MRINPPAFSRKDWPQMPWHKGYPADVDWFADYPPMTLPQMFGNAVVAHAARTCLRFMGRGWTYTEVAGLVARCAAGFQKLGVTRGTRVGLCLPNTPYYVVAYYGVLAAGGTVVNFNPLYAEREIAHQLADSGAEIMVTLNVRQIHPKVEALAGQGALKKVVVCDLAAVLPPVKGLALRGINAVKGAFGRGDLVRPVRGDVCVTWDSLMDNDGTPAPVNVTPDDVAVLQYTGGTTGVPKGAVLTHANLTANVRQTSDWLRAGRGDVVQETMLAVLPFFHVFSMTVQMNLTLFVGGRLVMLPKFEIKSLLKTITKEKPTIFAGVPTLYKAIADCPDINRYDLTSLELCVSGGAPLSPPVSAAFRQLTGLDLVEGYGLSETSPLVMANPVQGGGKTGSIGLPMPRTEARIVGLDDAAKDMPQGDAGEICLRGPQVMQGYWNMPDATKDVLRADGFLRTGDVGYMDEDGYVFIVDRIKDMIIASGFKVFTRKVEEAVLAHPAVGEVLAAGVPDAYRGETVKIWVVRKAGAALEEADLQAFLKDRLAAYERPKQVEFRDSLPKTMLGKPDRKALLAEEMARIEPS